MLQKRAEERQRDEPIKDLVAQLSAGFMSRRKQTED